MHGAWCMMLGTGCVVQYQLPTALTDGLKDIECQDYRCIRIKVASCRLSVSEGLGMINHRGHREKKRATEFFLSGPLFFSVVLCELSLTFSTCFIPCNHFQCFFSAKGGERMGMNKFHHQIRIGF